MKKMKKAFFVAPALLALHLSLASAVDSSKRYPPLNVNKLNLFNFGQSNEKEEKNVPTSIFSLKDSWQNICQKNTDC